MNQFKNTKSIVIGLALFSMFFGSGNLIFPFAVGRVSQGLYSYGALGFILTAVLVPFLGVVAMITFDGSYERFFSFLGKRSGLLLTFILLTFWIPLGSGPRCITLSHASIAHLFPQLPLWFFALVYSVLVFFLTIKKSRMMDVLGYILTPLLLTILGIVVFKGFFDAPALPMPSQLDSFTTFRTGLLEGYNTMDLIASFFFSATIIKFLKGSAKLAQQEISPSKTYLRFALQSCFIGIVILATVYLGLMYVAAAHAPILEGVAKESLLPALAHSLLGQSLGNIASLAVSLACLTTSIALASVYADFLKNVLSTGKLSHIHALLLTSIATWGMSTLGFEGVSRISEPVFQVFYPSLIVMILTLVPLRIIKQKRKNLEKAAPFPISPSSL